MPIKLDPRWNNGDYYGRDEPLDGTAQALKIVTITTRTFAWAERTFGYKWADPAKNRVMRWATASLSRMHSTRRASHGQTTTGQFDDLHGKGQPAYRLTDDEVKGMKAKILFVPASTDEIFPPELSRRAAERYKAQGGVAEVAVIEGEGGAISMAVFNVAKQGEAIRAFLAK